jgi:hypothetical protein
MLSTANFKKLPDKDNLRRICKAVSVLDAILSQEQEYRYFSYNAHWDEGEEFFEMRDGEGDHMLILFREEGCVINGFCHEYDQPEIKEITKGLPEVFNEFIFGEPVKSLGTTFCLWCDNKGNWEGNTLKENCSADMLFIFDGKPETYVDWATDYFEDSYKETGIPKNVVTAIYNEEPLTKEMVLNVVNDIEDWDLLQSVMEEIDYISQLTN